MTLKRRWSSSRRSRPGWEEPQRRMDEEDRQRRGAQGKRPLASDRKTRGSAKYVFHFDVQGSVAKSNHAGIPWLRFIRQRLGQRVHFGSFEGWGFPAKGRK